MKKISIAMSTYNGSKYIARQLDSILGQDFKNIQLAIVDDCSGDDTLSVVANFAASDNRISYKKNEVNFGVNRSFQEAILSCPDAEFYCLSDQDDIWPPDRLSQFIRSHESLRGTMPSDIPVLFVCQYRVFQDGQAVDANSATSAKLLSLDKEHIDWKKTLLSGNSLYGCCFFFNHALKVLVEKIPAGRTTHDYWIALVAAYTGNIVLLPFVGTNYRQHTSNASYGAPTRNLMIKLKRIGRSIREDIRSRRDIGLLLAELLRLHELKLNEPDRLRLAKAVRAYDGGSLTLFWFQLSHGAWRPNFLGNLLRILACFVEPFCGKK